MSPATHRPDPSEHLPYYRPYIDLVPDGDVITTLSRQLEDTFAVLEQFGEERGGHRYAPGKWSVKEVLGHLIDAERIFAYRALRFSRGDAQPLLGFEEDAYVAAASFDRCRLSDLAAELDHLRRANVLLFRQLDPEAWDRRGTANNAEVTVRALAWIMAGHELHHRKVLLERYL